MDKKVGYKKVVEPTNVKNSQFIQPLFEFSGACAGCGETPYIKLITQLFGERMMVANATGCSSIYGASAPSTPYCTNYKTGRGPAWANSLFEDNAEYGFGMAEGANRLRERVKRLLDENINSFSSETQNAVNEWIATYEDGEKTVATSDALAAALEKESIPVAKEILNLRPYFTKKSQWIFGGDGWAYDIGYGGVDHVLASGHDVNILVLDTEVYSNTGGQSSKSTPTGAVAKFAASGKRVRKKDLGMMAISYGYVYVAQVSMGANQAQYMKAIKEAEAYPGPSLIIAYAPCINHGLKSQYGQITGRREKGCGMRLLAIVSLYPLLEAEGKNPFQLDSKEPDYSKFREFLMGEVRFNSLVKAAPEDAEKLFEMTEANAKWRYEGYKRHAEMKYGEQ